MADYQATLHIHPAGQRAIQVATARVHFLNQTLQLHDLTTMDGTVWEGPLDPDEVGRMMQSSYLIILSSGRTYRVTSVEATDRWYVNRISG
ncbi:hypothetical protein [Tumebacillus permanentifrigoris]|uniref:Uncharacterized protein n=1 Tax=Tumebacillus permanentifrigoris TaxID=378543 RepID=A0A316D6J6_9BACL|nr:hypothetical protein [Tumebacillus permanentifrigoris]PWK11222.1 hypothetical protein C7459_11115 [Tumebacillus permanentifrigoris]